MSNLRDALYENNLIAVGELILNQKVDSVSWDYLCKYLQGKSLVPETWLRDEKYKYVLGTLFKYCNQIYSRGKQGLPVVNNSRVLSGVFPLLDLMDIYDASAQLSSKDVTFTGELLVTEDQTVRHARDYLVRGVCISQTVDFFISHQYRERWFWKGEEWYPRYWEEGPSYYNNYSYFGIVRDKTGYNIHGTYGQLDILIDLKNHHGINFHIKNEK